MCDFSNIDYEDDWFTTEDRVFLNPSAQIQQNLRKILDLCNWDIKELMQIFHISRSTCNNLLGNKSMTNEKPSRLSRTQLITLLMSIQHKKKNNKILLFLYLFSILCPGMGIIIDGRDFDSFQKIASLEDVLPPKLTVQNISHLFPNFIQTFNRFIEWRTKAPEVSVTEYYGHPDLLDYIFIEFENTESLDYEIEKVLKNKRKFIPLFLDWYISKLCEDFN